LAAVTLALAFLLGGGTRPGQWSDAIVQLVGLTTLVVAVSTLTIPRRLLLPLVILAAIAAIFLLQLLPLPPALWSALPGRGLVLENLTTASVTLTWMPISLDPGATTQAAFSLIPAAAIFVTVVQLDHPARRSLTLIVIVVAVVSVLLGVSQLVRGPGQLRLFPNANLLDSVGFFANRNHYSALLYAAIPLLAAWIVGLFHDRRPERILALAYGAVVLAILVLGLAMARSRAGLALAGLAAAGSLLIALRHGGPLAKRALLAMTVATVVGVLLAMHFAFFTVADRFNEGLLQDFRLTIADLSLTAAAVFQPLGSGFGTFVPVYQMFEPAGAILDTYINHAHNDWLELYLEGGWPALTVLAAFVLWFLAAAFRVWRAGASRGVDALDRCLACAASISVFALLLHSAVDYPLRTTALSSLFALCCALMIAPVPRLVFATVGLSDIVRGAQGLWPARRRRRAAAWSGRRYG
jgi:O-antigen ligase